MEANGALIYLLGGVAVFMYGIRLLSDHLKRLTENNVRDIFAQLSGKNYLAVLLGILLTIVMQSSGAVTSLLVSLGRAQIINLAQVMGVVIGTAVGSTLTVQLISFNITEWGFGLFTLGFFLFFVAKSHKLKSICAIGMGFGMILWGLEFMQSASNLLKSYPLLLEIFEELNRYPFWSFVVATLFSGFVHSSAVTIGLAMSFAAGGLINLEAAWYWIYGANLGTTSTALMMAVGGNYIGRRIAWAHFFYKLCGVAIFWFFTSQIATWMLGFDSTIIRSIANGHTLFNIVIALIFYPFIPIGVNLIEKLIQPRRGEMGFRAKYLREGEEVPFLVYSQAKREALRLGDLVKHMVEDSILLLKSKNEELEELLKEQDNKVDLLNHQIKMHLVELGGQGTKDLGKSILEVIDFASEFESAADVVVRSIIRLAAKKHSLKLEFSKDGWQEIENFHRAVVETISVSMACFNLENKEVSEKLITMKGKLKGLERQMRESHVERLNLGLKQSIDTSEIHMDVLSEYRRISSLVSSHAYNYRVRE